MGFEKDTIVIAAFGHISETKQYDFILEAMQYGNFFKQNNVRLVFVGDFINDEYKLKVNKIIEKYKLQKRVEITGFVSDGQYRSYLLASDIGINLRINSRGETSRALLMNMAYGLPTIINDYASFSEIPDSSACKIALDSKKDFILQMKLLINNKNIRNEIGKNAYRYITSEHNIDQIAKEYYEFILKFSKQTGKTLNPIEEIADIIVEQKLDEVLSDNEYIKMANILKITEERGFTE